MKINKNHPFVQAMLKAEKLEQIAGQVTDEVLELRHWAKAKYPELFKRYLIAKSQEQNKEMINIVMAKEEEKTTKKIRNRAILKNQFTKACFGKGPRDL